MKKTLIFLMLSLFLISCDNQIKIEPANEKNDTDSVFVEIDSSDTDEEPANEKNDTAGETDSEKNDVDVSPHSIEFESGYIEIEPVEYTLDTKTLNSGRARIWYNFQPANENPEKKPLFVFFNGGPGAASLLLFAYNTSKMTADQAFSEFGVVENEFDWNRLGNLLYIDARMTGFSYGITDNPSNKQERSSYFKAANFNVFIDAADFIRVILRFLANHPDIEANKVVLVGESYGGTRATAMLNILLNIRDYADDKRFFFDKSLFDEIDAHFMKINPEISALPHKEIVKQQFAEQILIQPLVTGDKQFSASGKLLEASNSPLYEVEKESGVKYNPCSTSYCNPHNNALQYLQKAGRDMYSYRKPYNWLFDYSAVGADKIVQIELFEKLIQNNPRKVNWLYAENRNNAFRYVGDFALKGEISQIEAQNLPKSVATEINYRLNGMRPLAVGNLEAFFGELQVWDDYYIDLHRSVTQLFYSATTTPYSSVNGYMFIENICDIKTFITNAEEDVVIYALGIPESLKEFNGIESVSVKDESFEVNFTDGVKTEVFFPFYPESSHSVSVNQPQLFLNDVKKWMSF
ncbi:MAG: S10 family serine carboxypeptidase-like protein [bacterium]